MRFPLPLSRRTDSIGNRRKTTSICGGGGKGTDPSGHDKNIDAMVGMVVYGKRCVLS